MARARLERVGGDTHLGPLMDFTADKGSSEPANLVGRDCLTFAEADGCTRY